MKRAALGVVAAVLCACGSEDAAIDDTGSESAAVTPVAGGLTSHFQSWLSANGYSSYDFTRSDLLGGSYGGKASATTPVVNQPVIFVHGNSDRAIGGTYDGWSDSIDYFLANGYSSAELYATTWGDGSTFDAAYQNHSKENVMRVRKFIEAVIAYTGATKVDIIGHSMGVTLARKAIKGGSAYDQDTATTYSVGSSLTSKVDTFVGISGANRGLTNCYYSGPTTPTCDAVNGLYPGYLTWLGVLGRSDFLDDLAASSSYEGAYRYTIFSTVDEIIGYGGIVYGEYTARIPGQTDEVVFGTVPYGHFGTKDLTADYQLDMVKFHAP